MEMKCLIVLLQISWVFAQGGGGAGDDFNMGDFGGFSLLQKDIASSDGAGASNETANDTSTDQHSLSQPGGGGEQLLFQPGGAMQGDQPEQQPVVPTRAPAPAGPSTAPPLVRTEGNSTGNATTAAPPATEPPKPKGQGDGSAAVIGNIVLIFGGACVLHLLY